MSVLLLIAALVFFLLAALGVPTFHPRVQWMAWGLFFGFLWLGVAGEGLAALTN